MDKFSISKIIQYLTCPRAFEYIYLHHFELKKSDNMFFGSAIHEGMAAHFRGEDPIKKFIHFSKSQGWQKPKGYDEEKNLKSGIAILEAYQKKGTYFEPNLEWIEQRKTIQLTNPLSGEKIAKPFTFMIDLVTKDGYIVDHKTASSGHGEQNETNKIQGIAYTMAYRSIFGKKPRGFIQNTIVKLKTPRFIAKVFKYTDDEELYVFNMIKHVLERIENRGYLVDKPSIKTFYPCPIGVLCDIHRKIK